MVKQSTVRCCAFDGLNRVSSAIFCFSKGNPYNTLDSKSIHSIKHEHVE